MSFAVRIDHWSVSEASASVYTPPEARGHGLVGIVFGHPTSDDGTRVRTSAIVDARGRRVTTASGTVYLLGEIDPTYAAYLRGIGRVVDEDEPITMVRAG